MSSVLTKTPALSRMTFAVPASEAAAALRASQMTALSGRSESCFLSNERSTHYVEIHQLSVITFVAPIVWLRVPVLLTLGLYTWGTGCMQDLTAEMLGCSYARPHSIDILTSS